MSLGNIGENHGTCEETGMQHGGIPRYRGNGMYEKCGSELERPYPSPKGKEKAYKLGEIAFLMGGSRMLDSELRETQTTNYFSVL